jgi:hypothetical protein
MTFLSRLELPILENQPNFEGRWTNPQNQKFIDNWQYGWSLKDTEQFIDIKLKSECYSILDRTEDLMYRILSMISSLQSRGHKILLYQQADTLYQPSLDDPRLALFKNVPAIVDGYKWRCVSWQLGNQVPAMAYGNSHCEIPEDMRHPASGHHQLLNEFLVNYINQNGGNVNYIVYDFSPEKIIENSIHIPYPLSVYKRSEKINIALDRSKSDFISMPPC